MVNEPNKQNKGGRSKADAREESGRGQCEEKVREKCESEKWAKKGEYAVATKVGARS